MNETTQNTPTNLDELTREQVSPVLREVLDKAMSPRTIFDLEHGVRIKFDMRRMRSGTFSNNFAKWVSEFVAESAGAYVQVPHPCPGSKVRCYMAQAVIDRLKAERIAKAERERAAEKDRDARREAVRDALEKFGIHLSIDMDSDGGEYFLSIDLDDAEKVLAKFKGE